ncbi:hypothetical protein AURDEDRAFT_114463 [Auricularia subglabra TFB-10046 SS5]|nr:hypothetical protein AURDEDRAFT_114463 [Auricularia subglabra TFB-10046 SS5]
MALADPKTASKECGFNALTGKLTCPPTGPIYYAIRDQPVRGYQGVQRSRRYRLPGVEEGVERCVLDVRLMPLYMYEEHNAVRGGIGSSGGVWSDDATGSQSANKCSDPPGQPSAARRRGTQSCNALAVRGNIGDQACGRL